MTRKRKCLTKADQINSVAQVAVPVFYFKVRHADRILLLSEIPGGSASLVPS